MLEVVESAGVKHMVGFNYRFAPAVMLAKKLVDEGKLGEIYHFRAWFLQDWLVDPNFPLAWRLQKEIAGSGAHGDLGAHLIDLAHYLIGDITEVIGMNETFIKERPLLVPQWKEILDFDTFAKGEGSPVKNIVDGSLFQSRHSGIAAVSNIGNDYNWTGHTLAQANLYGFGRLTWNPVLSSETITNEWTLQTFGKELVVQ